MNEENRRELEYAHRFAIEQIRDESRGFWTKVATLLTVNSLLIAGFALIYSNTTTISIEDITTILLLAIAASGIAIQAMWFWFTVQSYAHFRAFYNIVSTVETERKSSISGLIPEASEPWTTFSDYRSKFLLGLYPRENFAAVISIILFASIFTAIWTVALLFLSDSIDNRGIAIFLLYFTLSFVGLSAFLSLMYLLRIRFFGKRRRKLGSTVFIVCFLTGIGIGIGLGKLLVGIPVGLGVGFLGALIVSCKTEK